MLQVGSVPTVLRGNRRQSESASRQRDGELPPTYRRRTLRVRNNRLQLRRLSKILHAIRSERNQTDAKWHRSTSEGMGRNEKNRRNSQQRLPRSGHRTPMLLARRSPKPTRSSGVSRVLSVSCIDGQWTISFVCDENEHYLCSGSCGQSSACLSFVYICVCVK